MALANTRGSARHVTVHASRGTVLASYVTAFAGHLLLPGSRTLVPAAKQGGLARLTPASGKGHPTHPPQPPADQTGFSGSSPSPPGSLAPRTLRDLAAASLPGSLP